MLEHERAVVVVQMLVEAQAWRSARDQARQRGLAHGKRIAAKVIPVQLDQVESPKEDAGAMAPVSHSLKAGDAVVAAGDCLAVDDAGACAQAGESLDDPGEASDEIISRSAIEPHTFVDLAGDDPKAVVL